MRRVELIRKVQRAGRVAGKDWWLVREGGEHEIWACGSVTVSIPRHREINERTAGAILRDLAGELGEDWWRR